MTTNLLLVFWFHLAGDILYHRNLKTKRGFFIFSNSYIFFRVVIREMIKKKDRIAGLGRAISEQMSGDDFSHERQKWCHKERIIDRGNNRYIEIVIDTETGELIHYCEEPLNQHFGHKSAKIGGQT